MSVREKKPTNCHFCGYLCAFIATVEEGRVVDIEPDASRYPYDETITRSCRRWRMNLDFIDAENRINHPLRRKGDRGAGEWERVTWDEALDDIEKRLKTLFDEHGSRTLASAIGGPHTNYWPLHRFMNLVGSPNNMGIGQICWNPRIWMDVITFGWTVEGDLNPAITQTLFLWGTNPAQSDNSAFWRSLVSLSKQGIPFVVVDPRYTQTARLADLWLPLKPGTDAILALAMINILIEKDMVDHDFIERWCYGFDELVEHVKEFTPEKAASACGLAVKDIEKAACLFGEARAAALISGRGIDQSGQDVAPTHRALCCLRAITGNVDKKGSCILTEKSDFLGELDLEMSASISDYQREQCLNTSFSPLQCYEGYEYISTLTGKLNRRLPLRYMTSAHPDLVLKAMETGKPYPIRALIVDATNPLLTYADTHRTYKALCSLDLLVVLEYTMTPTAALADYVLPVAAAIERPVMQMHGGVANMAYGGPAAVSPYYERKTDYDIFRQLGLRFGQAQQWPHETLEDALDEIFKPVNLTWEQFCSTGVYWRAPAPHKHEMPDAEGKQSGFATETGRIELASVALEKLGGQRLPYPSERVWPRKDLRDQGKDGQNISPEKKSGVKSAPASKGYQEEAADAKSMPLTLITGARKQPYNASVFFDNPAFRERYPHPVAEMDEYAAASRGLVEGDTLMVKNEKGQAIFTLKTSPMCADVISVDYGWWFPERSLRAPSLGGVWQSNINTLTSCALEEGESMIGTWAYNGLSCCLEKLDAL